MVKNLLANAGNEEMQETWIQFLGQEDPLEKEMSTYSMILAWKIPGPGGAWWTTLHRVAKSWPLDITLYSYLSFNRHLTCKVYR